MIEIKLNIVDTDLNDFQTKLEKLNKKLESHNTQVEIIKEIKVFPKEPLGIIHHEITLKATSSIIKRDCEVLAMIKFNDGKPLVFKMTDDTYISLDYESLTPSMNCDHCNTTRQRNSYLVLREKGEIKFIGSSCAENYTGIDIMKSLSICQAFMDSFETDFSPRTPSYVSLDTLSKVTSFVTSKFKTWEKSVTSFAIKESLSDSKCYDNDIDVKTTIKNLYSTYQNPKNDFERNIHNLLPEGDKDLYVPISLCGLVAYGIYSSNNSSNNTPNSLKTANSDYVGDLGDQLEIKAKYIDAVYFDNDYGYYGGVTCIYTFQDEKGNILTTTTSDTTKLACYLDEERPFNETFIIKGRIKEHKLDFKERKITTLNRLSLKPV